MDINGYNISTDFWEGHQNSHAKSHQIISCRKKMEKSSLDDLDVNFTQVATEHDTPKPEPGNSTNSCDCRGTYGALPVHN